MSVYDLDIKVYVENPKSEPPKFRLECQELEIKPGKKHDFIFRNPEGCDGFLLRFILQGDAHGYRFPRDAGLAMYSAKGIGCPTEPGHWHQFVPLEVKSGDKILIVRNYNRKGHEGDFGYTLRLTKNPNDYDMPEDEFLLLDPGGFNGNGGPKKALTAAAVAIAVLSGIASALVTTAALVTLGFVG